MAASPTPRPKRTKTIKPKQILDSRRGKKAPTVRIVEVHWIDALGVIDWEEPDTWKPSTAPSLAIGYLVEETEDYIAVVSLVNENHYSHGTTIPRGCIVKLVELA